MKVSRFKRLEVERHNIDHELCPNKMLQVAEMKCQGVI